MKRTPVGIRNGFSTHAFCCCARGENQPDESTLVRIYALHELHNLGQRGITRGALIDYHTRYKLILLAHSQPEYREIGPFVATIHEWENLNAFYIEYRSRLAHLLLNNATRRNHTNVLMHVQGYFRNQLTLRQRQQLTSLIDSYRREEQPLLAPLMLLKHYMAEHPNSWLSGQRYFELWPAILHLRCHH